MEIRSFYMDQLVILRKTSFYTHFFFLKKIGVIIIGVIGVSNIGKIEKNLEKVALHLKRCLLSMYLTFTRFSYTYLMGWWGIYWFYSTFMTHAISLLKSLWPLIVLTCIIRKSYFARRYFFYQITLEWGFKDIFHKIVKYEIY